MKIKVKNYTYDHIQSLNFVNVKPINIYVAQQIIEGLLLGIEPPRIYVMESPLNEKIKVIIGQNLISAFLMFNNNELGEYELKDKFRIENVQLNFVKLETKTFGTKEAKEFKFLAKLMS